MLRIPGQRLLPVALVALVLASGVALGQDAPKVEERQKAGAKGKQRQPTLPFKGIRLPKGHASEVVFSRDGTKMAVGTAATITVWQVADGKELVRMQLPQEQLFHRLVFAPDDKTLVYNGREDPLVRIFDAKTGRQARELPQPDPSKERREAARAAAVNRGKLDKAKDGDFAFSSQLRCYSADGTHGVQQPE